ncbi:MAG TPA: tyrosine--tRNA ligase, partial [Candidatus Saccharimonadales bacterium]|nr:tyrosine--tRNA ligase [Candidatus Saccharimonadales bacterium]
PEYNESIEAQKLGDALTKILGSRSEVKRLISQGGIDVNGEKIEDIIKLSQHFSFGDFASRELVAKRLKSGKKVGLHEALYPVMQGYDSYYLDTDIQIGGADQTFNMQAGRTLQRDIRNKKSYVLVTGYLEGTDGRKMSKSWGNAIWLDDKAEDMYGKVMSVKDDLILTYFRLATNLSEEEIDEREKRLKTENPINLKKELAFQIVKELHSEKDAKRAEGNFSKTFQEKEPEYNESIEAQKLGDALTKILGSRSEVKRLISQGGIDVNGEKIEDINLELKSGDKVNLGKRRFLSVK